MSRIPPSFNIHLGCAGYQNNFSIVFPSNWFVPPLILFYGSRRFRGSGKINKCLWYSSCYLGCTVPARMVSLSAPSNPWQQRQPGQLGPSSLMQRKYSIEELTHLGWFMWNFADGASPEPRVVFCICNPNIAWQ